MLRVISKIRFGFCEVPKVKKPRKRRTAKIDWHQRDQWEQKLKQSQYITYMYRKDQDPSLLVLDRFQHLEPKNPGVDIERVQVEDDKILKDLEEKEQFLQDLDQQKLVSEFELELQGKVLQALSTSIPEYDSRQFRELYENLFSEKIFDFFSVEEFTLLLESPQFVKDIKTFPDQFFQQNQFVVYSSKFVSIALEEAFQGDQTLLSKIQFADQIDQANYFENNNGIHKILSDFKGNYDQLKVLFLLHQSAYSPLFDSNTFIYLLKLLSRIEWGGVQYSKKQQQAISDLLFIKLQVQSNVPIMSFLADIFFTNLKYDSALLSVANTILILERIFYGKNLTDLLHIFKITFGTKKFNYYFRDSLPKVLDSFQNKTYYSNYTLQLKIYEKQNKFFIQRLGFLDSTFFASHKLRVHESAVEYQNNGFNLQSLNIDQDKTLELEQFQKSIIDGNTNLALIKLKNKFPHFQNEKDIAFKVTSELYQSVLYKLDLEQAQQSLIDRDEQYFEHFEKILDQDAEKWAKEQQAKWDAKNATNQAVQPQKAEETQENSEKIVEGSTDVSSTPQAGFGAMKPKFGFSTLKPAIEIKEGNKGFLDYLRSAKNIDTEVNEKENQRIEDQIKEIDQIIKQDQKNIKQQKSEQSSYEHRIHFKPVQFENKRAHKEVKITQEIKEEISDQIKSQDNKNQIKKQKINIEQQLQDQALIDQAKSDIAYAFDSDLNQAQQSQRLLTQLKELKNGQYSPYLIKALINQFGSTAAQQFSNLFFYQNNDFKLQGIELKVSYETQYGLVEKDLSGYLQGNLIQSSLGQVGYDQLLQRQQEDFKRSHFKKILSHYALYEKQLFDSTLELICKIIADQKIPQTLTEYIYLFSKHDVKLTKDQIILVSDTLMHFKDYEVEVCQLLLNVYKKNDFIVVYSDFQNFVKKSIERAKRDLYMSFYENIKDAMLSRKQKIEQQTEVSEKQQDQSWIQTKKELFGEFVRNMVSDLGKYNQEDCRLIMNDARLIRYNFKEIDYVNWIYANEKFPEEVEKIYNDYLKRYPEGNEFAKIIIAMQKAFQNNPNQTKILFQDIVKQHVFSKKYQFTDSQITELTNSFRRMKEFSSFSHFLMMLMDQGYKINQNHKTLFYNVMNSADDDLQKSTIKGIVDQMILDDKDKDKAKKQTNYTTSEVFEFIPPQKEELNVYPSLDRNRKNFISRQQFMKFGFMLEEDQDQDTQIGKPVKLGKPSNKKK